MWWDDLADQPTLKGKCNDGHDYFPERGTAQITARDAKAICNGTDGTGQVCPVLQDCLEYAVARRERFGIWGGKSERERAKIIKARKVERELIDTRPPVEVSHPAATMSLDELVLAGVITEGEREEEHQRLVRRTPQHRLARLVRRGLLTETEMQEELAWITRRGRGVNVIPLKRGRRATQSKSKQRRSA